MQYARVDTLEVNTQYRSVFDYAVFILKLSRGYLFG
jgi:hypothetical protein